jgi:serine/threonine-protein kinase
MRSCRPIHLAGLAGLLAAVCLGPESARAQSANDKAAAEALFDEGKKLLDQNRTAEACQRFEASQKLDAGVGTLLFLADCYERTDRFASAWATFREAAAMAKTAADDKREKIARGRADSLEGKLFKLTVAAQEPLPGLVIKRDGETIEQSVWGVALPVDAGSHTIEASAPGYVTFTRKVDVPKTSGAETVVVPKLEKDTAPPPTTTAPPTASPPVAPPPQPPPPPPRDERGNGLLIGGLVVGGLGVVGLAVTGALAGVATSKYAEGDDSCEGTVCSDPAAVQSANDARQLGDVATGTFIAGLGLAAVGATLVIVHFATAPDEGAAVQVGFTGAPDGGRFGMWGRF